ncbi:MAG: DUF4834 family protein [Cytophagales bacterium]|nr:DUF4834 family protein [Cytophagales bacterium]
MGAILKFIIIFICATWIIRKVSGYFLKSYIKKRTDSFRQQQEQQYRQYQQAQRKEGEIHVEHTSGSKTGNNIRFDDGEYVDYEEVKD